MFHDTPRRAPTPGSESFPVVQPPQGVLSVDWALFGELCRGLALKVYHAYDPDVVVGIAKAGVIPAAVIASILQVEFASMAVTRREAGESPYLVTPPPPSVRGRRVLLVDETCNSGHTLRIALHEVRQRQPAEVRTAVSFRTGPYQPDFHALATEQAIILPWDREIIEDGALAIRPDYRRWLDPTL